MWFERKKKPTDMSFDKLSVVFENVTWARRQINDMLEVVAEHKADHFCEIYCVPFSVHNYLQTLSPESLRILVLVMLKDAVIQEDADEESR